MRINGQAIQVPTKCELGRFIISRSQRTSSGLMRTEIIARKRRLNCEWAWISAAALKHIHDLLESGATHTVEFVDTRSGEAATMTIYVGDMNQNIAPVINGVRWWRDASISLIEV